VSENILFSFSKLMTANKNMPNKLHCELCDYSCCKKSCWNQHLLTRKHILAKNGLMSANKIYACDNCNVKFKHQSSYCRQKKKCNLKSELGI